MVIRALAASDFEAVHAAFLEAFSDYFVPLKLTREQLGEMLTRRGWVPEASVAIFEAERIVAFTLNGVDGEQAYDSGTGVVPSHRRRGLGRQMMDFIEPELRRRGCRLYVLEVLEQNVAAAALYAQAGFEETRRFQCWRFEATSLQVDQSSRDLAPRRLDDWTTLQLWWDITPSWQNSTHSLLRAKDPYEVLGTDDGYAIVFPSNGDLAQLAVRPEARRRGLGTRLLHAAAAAAGKPLRILNLDDRDEEIAAFLEAAGAVRTVRQLEMVKTL